ncbi:MAG TPA: diacylglycerol kinase family protein [Streptosporangiaceae bacterium]|nr:diacylglycerol kinase family protein [Streptosporangiaceae bacterium]
MRVRALLIVNPQATSTTRPVLDLIVRSLAARVEIETVETRYRGHAREIAAAAAAEGRDAVLVLSGDGTINEVVNGLMAGAAPAGDPPPEPTARRLPAVGALPGGNANVFARALGVPADPAGAAERVGSRLAAGTTRTIGLGMAGDRYFTFSAGLGFDAETVRAVEDRRAHGRRASPGLYMRTALGVYYRVIDRRHPALTVEAPDRPAIEGLAMVIVSNTAPWTYVGPRPVNPTPYADFNTGLDLFALRRLTTFSTLNTVRQMLGGSGRPPAGKYAVSLHDEPELKTFSAAPTALQVDGEFVGEPESVTFRSVPDALRVIA